MSRDRYPGLIDLDLDVPESRFRGIETRLETCYYDNQVNLWVLACDSEINHMK